MKNRAYISLRAEVREAIDEYLKGDPEYQAMQGQPNLMKVCRDKMARSPDLPGIVKNYRRDKREKESGQGLFPGM